MAIPFVASVKSLHPGYTKYQWTFLALFALASFGSNMIFSIQGPLYPPKAKERGLTPATFGAVMATNCGMMAVASLFSTGAEKAGLRAWFGWSAFLCGVYPILMGFLDYVESYTAFTTLSVLSLMIDGIGQAGIYSSVYILCLLVFPHRTSLAIGVIEGSFQSATSLGPLLCEVIFTKFGFTVTYLIFGMGQMLITLAIFAKLPPVPLSTESSSKPHPTFIQMFKGYYKILKYPSVLIYAINLVALEMGNDFLTTTLEPSLKAYRLTRIGVGLVYFASGAPQILVPIWGLLLDRMKRPELFLVSSLLIMVVSVCFIGPFSFMPFERSFGVTLFGQILFGFGEGMMDVAAVVNFQLEVKEKSNSESSSINFSFIAVVCSFVNGIGGCLGPAISGALYQYVGYKKSFYFLVFTHGTLAILIFCIIARRRFQPRRVLGGYDMLD